MKKLYATLARNDRNYPGSSCPLFWIKGVSFAAIVAFLSNVSPVSAGINIDNGDVHPNSVTEIREEQSAEVSTAAPVNEQAATFGSVDAGVMNVGVTANAEGLQANDQATNINEESQFGELFSPVTERALVSYNNPTSLRAGLAASTEGQQPALSDENPSIINVADLLRGAPTNGMQRGINVNNIIFGNNMRIPNATPNDVIIGNNVSWTRPGDLQASESVIIGESVNLSKGGDVVAIGYKALLKGDDAVAIGFKAEVDKSQSIAVGHLSHAIGVKSIAIGGEGRWKNEPTPPEGRTESGGDYSIAVGHRAKTSKQDSIAIGRAAKASGMSSIAIGSLDNTASADKESTIAKADYTVAVGNLSKALEYGGVALGHRAYTNAKNAIALGFYAKANVETGVALGSDSVADRAAGVRGYSPTMNGITENANTYWKSTSGAVSVGDVSKHITRQITNVAAGSEDSDAVNVAQLRDLQAINVAQLKDLKTFVKNNGWKLSVGGENATAVLIDNAVDFAAGSTNLTITKGDKDNKLKFDLAKDVTLNSAKVGNNTLDATGLVIGNGPKITTAGISAGNKEIKDIKAGELSATSNQAVNGSQLFETNQNVTTAATNIAKAFGGGAGYASGKWSNPSFKVKSFASDGDLSESTYHSVAEALADVGNSFTNIKNEINAEKSNELVKWDKDTKTITIGKEK
ncbi:hypothetical protein MEI_01508, partial [Bartonella vinsonii subsp. arupensis Pm136co]